MSRGDSDCDLEIISSIPRYFSVAGDSLDWIQATPIVAKALHASDDPPGLGAIANEALDSLAARAQHSPSI
jgi:hypothetical protein